ncbi:MAG: hypothetical protein H0U52_06850 [Chloroflexi bacterium]|nr:hypothetical protein [Chloroflexota bacterium]
MRTLVALLEDKLLAIPVTAARPALITDGSDITSWRTGGAYSPTRAAMFVDGTVAASFDSPTGGASGAELWGYRLSQWWLIGYLNNGTAVPIVGNLQGFSQEIDIIGIFDRLAVAGIPSAGAANVQMAPIEEWH